MRKKYFIGEIPKGRSKEDRKKRILIIKDFYKNWKIENPGLRKYNIHLKKYINIQRISITETSFHASASFLATLAVLQLDQILVNAIVIGYKKNSSRKNQERFKHIIIMSYYLVGIGEVKLTVGVKKHTGDYIQYCITEIQTKKAP